MNKPTHPGFYWYQAGQHDKWEPVEVYRVPMDGLRVEFLGMEGSDAVSRLTGEWGPEIVHAD